MNVKALACDMSWANERRERGNFHTHRSRKMREKIAIKSSSLPVKSSVSSSRVRQVNRMQEALIGILISCHVDLLR
jgi:hypothetical protein